MLHFTNLCAESGRRGDADLVASRPNLLKGYVQGWSVGIDVQGHYLVLLKFKGRICFTVKGMFFLEHSGAYALEVGFNVQGVPSSGSFLRQRHIYALPAIV